MRIPIYQVDAFASRVFAGNPAAVCPLPRWLNDALLQSIANENNLSETAFVVPEGDAYAIRWFTPRVEVDLCGHATLAAAHIVMEHLVAERLERIRFHSRSGPLFVTRDGERLALDFPARPARRVDMPQDLAAALGSAPREVWEARDLLAVYDSEDEVRELAPDFAAVAALEAFAVCATAPGKHVDFVSRFFAPAQGVDEDPVTGSAHCTLVPYWGARLGRDKLHARQISSRGGELFCTRRGERVTIAGHAVRFLEGWIEVDPELPASGISLHEK